MNSPKSVYAQYQSPRLLDEDWFFPRDQLGIVCSDCGLSTDIVLFAGYNSSPSCKYCRELNALNRHLGGFEEERKNARDERKYLIISAVSVLLVVVSVVVVLIDAIFTIGG